jgi:hypothetical protein
VGRILWSAIFVVGLVLFAIGRGSASAVLFLTVVASAVGLAAWYWVDRPLELRRERKAKGLCPHCGYDLTGNVSGVCPECGTDASNGDGFMKTTMTFAGIAGVLGALAVGCASATGGGRPATAAAAPPRVCPYGHAAIKSVPVSYGVLPRPMPPELERQIDNLEVVPGGCCYVSGESPDNVFICTRCRYEFDPSTRSWDRGDADPATFERPLSAAVRRFPLTHEADARDVYYGQVVEAGKVVREHVSFLTDETPERMAKRVARLIIGYGQVPERNVEDLVIVKQTSYRFRTNGAYGEVTLMPLTGPARRGTVVTYEWPTEPPLPDASWTGTGS